jgi:hypothetical protein
MRCADGSALRAGPVRPCAAPVDDGRGARGLGVGWTRETFVLGHRGRSRTVLRVLRAASLLPPCWILACFADGRAPAALARSSGSNAACGACCRKDFHHGGGREPPGRGDVPFDPCRPVRPVRAHHLTGGPRRAARSAHRRPGGRARWMPGWGRYSGKGRGPPSADKTPYNGER